MAKKNIKKKKSKSKFLNKMKKSLFVSTINDEFNNISFSIVEMIIIVLISLLFGIVVGYFITFDRNYSIVNSDKKVQEIVNTYNNIINSYYDKVDKDDLANAAIKGMINSLNDPYSNYMNSSITDSFNETIDGSYVGIGIVVMFENEYNKVVTVNSNGPAGKVGIKENDIIIKVNGKSVKGVSGEKFSKLIKGKKGNDIKLTVKRGNKNKTFVIKRDIIEIDVVTDEFIKYDNKKIGYIKIESFATNSYSQFKKTLKKLEGKNIESLIIDVRDNPGGHLLQTKQILSLFFNKKTVLYQIYSKDNKEKVYSESNVIRKYPVVILINGGSASASEILASCFKDNYKDSYIIGTKSYGKGTVQKSQTLVTGSSIKYTTEKWLTSKGKWIDGKGIKPDIEVELNEEYYAEPIRDNDNQLLESLKKLKES